MTWNLLLAQLIRYWTKIFKSMDTYCTSNKTWILGLTRDTSTALYITLNGIVKLILLLTRNLKHAFTVRFQRDKIKGEFGRYRLLSGRNYCIVIQQVINNLTFQRLKLFNVLTLEESSSNHHDSCCAKILEEHEIDGPNIFIEELWLNKI